MGEDPEVYNNREKFEEFLHTITEVQKKTDLPVMVSPGVVSFETISAFAERNVSCFACYQETHDQGHFNRLRNGQNYQQRIDVKLEAKKSGILIEEGILLGTGETIEDITDSILWMRDNEVDQARAMTYIAPENSPLPAMPQNMVEEQIVLAVMRLAMPERLIPASLDIDGLDSLASRLDAGANVITSIVPPDQGLVGVANRSLDIEEQRRSVVQIQPVLDLCNLVPATASEYKP